MLLNLPLVLLRIRTRVLSPRSRPPNPLGLVGLLPRALNECVLAPHWFHPLLELIGVCPRCRLTDRLDALSLVQAPSLSPYGSVHNLS